LKVSVIMSGSVPTVSRQPRKISSTVAARTSAVTRLAVTVTMCRPASKASALVLDCTSRRFNQFLARGLIAVVPPALRGIWRRPHHHTGESLPKPEATAAAIAARGPHPAWVAATLL
jgi:hypothetical protein